MSRNTHLSVMSGDVASLHTYESRVGVDVDGIRANLSISVRRCVRPNRSYHPIRLAKPTHVLSVENSDPPAVSSVFCAPQGS